MIDKDRPDVNSRQKNFFALAHLSDPLFIYIYINKELIKDVSSLSLLSNTTLLDPNRLIDHPGSQKLKVGSPPSNSQCYYTLSPYLSHVIII